MPPYFTAKLKGKRSRDESERTKVKILQAALTIFARDGFERARLRDIAAAAGTTHSLIRHHFGSKDDLWRAVVDHGLKLHENRLRQILASHWGDDPVELFKSFIRSHIAFVAKHIEVSKILLHDNCTDSSHLDYIVERQERVHRITEPIFRKAQALGYFEGFDHDSFSIYMRVVTDTPIATSDLTNKVCGVDIRSPEGIALHSDRVIRLLFGHLGVRSESQ